MAGSSPGQSDSSVAAIEAPIPKVTVDFALVPYSDYVRAFPIRD
jgi:hypothetical protein